MKTPKYCRNTYDVVSFVVPTLSELQLGISGDILNILCYVPAW